MSILNYEEMTLESDTFQAARETFNLMMQKLFRKMEQSDMDEGSIDLKISIELNEDFVPQEDGTTVRIKKPLIKHKISTVVPVKDSADGESDGMMTVPDNVDEETDTDVPSGDYDSTDDSGMPLPFSEGDDDYPYDDPMEE